MIAVDTNVLVRLLVGDDPAQAAKAQRCFDRAAEGDVSIWVSDTVLVELAWTLGKAYARDRRDIVMALRALSSHATVVLESPAAVRSATDAFEQGPPDFADCLLSMKAKAAGCDQLVTFDRGMKGLPGVRLL
ncbi:MAG: type II toxin-antitoxin system VapC family toxin [Burkholderiaceae bacterium]|nr:type II toxin-antitoxin system VapC family toxin [Burkholderiaceae bacterium]